MWGQGAIGLGNQKPAISAVFKSPFLAFEKKFGANLIFRPTGPFLKTTVGGGGGGGGENPFFFFLFS